MTQLQSNIEGTFFMNHSVYLFSVNLRCHEAGITPEGPTILRCGKCVELSWAWRGTCSGCSWRRCSSETSPSCNRQIDKTPGSMTEMQPVLHYLLPAKRDSELAGHLRSSKVGLGWARFNIPLDTF